MPFMAPSLRITKVIHVGNIPLYAQWAEPIVSFYANPSNAYGTSTISSAIAISSAPDTATYTANGTYVTVNKAGTYNYSFYFTGSGYFAWKGYLYVQVNGTSVASGVTKQYTETNDGTKYHEGANYLTGSLTLNAGDMVRLVYTMEAYHGAWVGGTLTYTGQ